MKIKKVDDKPMVIHTKKKAKLHTHEPKKASIKAGNSRGYWYTTHTVAINMAMTKERLIGSGFYDLATAYQSVHINY